VTAATAQRHLPLNMTANGSLGPESEDAAEGQLHELRYSPPRLQPLGAVGADRAPLISGRGVLGRIAEIVAGILAEASTRLWLWKGTTCTPSAR
jgi:hypothetical protein